MQAMAGYDGGLDPRQSPGIETMDYVTEVKLTFFLKTFDILVPQY